MSMGKKPAAQKDTHALGLDFQGAQYGNCIPVVFGQNKLPGNVIWYGDFKAIAHKQKPAGGKGGGGGESSKTYTYQASFQIGLQEGVGSVVQVFNGTGTQSVAQAGGLVFSGTLTQAPWAHLAGVEALGYSGTMHIDFQNLNLGDNASLPNFNFEVTGRNQLGGGVLDANPAAIITAICTDTQVGVSFGALGDLTQLTNYCTAAGLLFSPVYDTQQAASQTIEDLLKYANAAGYFSEGVLKVVPYGDSAITGNGVTYTPNMAVVVDLGANDFITNGPGPAITIKRKSPADALNVVHLEYRDRSLKYRKIPVAASIDQDVVATGFRTEQSASVDMITVGATARLVAQNMLQRMYYVRNTYVFKLPWRYCYLEPTDIVSLTDPNTGLNLTPVRITSIGEDAAGLLAVEAEELPDGIGHGGAYATQTPTSTTTNADADPGPITAPYLFRAPGFLVSAGAPEIWAALGGADPMWGGCEVYISQTGASYTYLSTFARNSTYGYATTALGANADPDTTHTLNVVLNNGEVLLGGTATDADEFVTLAMLDSELISYQTATLAAGPSYNLGTRIRRGAYGTAIAAHATNAPFVRLDENILRIPMDPSQLGKTIYLKFVSFNVFGRGGRTLASETAYPYVIGSNIEFPDVPATPTGFSVVGVADGINLKWTNPNPAAAACTSIEFSTAVGGPFTVLGQEGPTVTTYHHAFTAGTTYYYRVRARGFAISAGWSAYTSILSSAGMAFSGNGINIEWDEYARQLDAVVPPTSPLNGGVAPTIDMADRFVGDGGCLLTTTASTNQYEGYHLGIADTDYNLPIRPGKYIVSMGVKVGTAGHVIGLTARNNGDATYLPPQFIAIATANAWTRVSYVVDFTGVPSATAILPYIYVNQSAVAGRTVRIDGIMVEPMTGTATSPSPFVAGNPARIATNALNTSSDPIVINGGFEQGTLGWTLETGAYLEASTNAAFTGSTGVVLSAAAGTRRVYQTKMIPVQPGQQLVIAAAIRNLGGAATGECGVELLSYDAAGSFIGSTSFFYSAVAAIGSSTWRSVSKKFTVLDGVSLIRVGVVTVGQTAGYWCADGVRANVVDSQPVAPSTGENLVPNGNFTSNLGNWPLTVPVAVMNRKVTDGWYVGAMGGAFVSAIGAGLELGLSGPLRNLFVGDLGGTLGITESAYVYMLGDQLIPVSPGERLFVEGIGQVDAANARPAGVTAKTYMGAWCYGADGTTQTGYVGLELINRLGGINDTITSVVPANTAFIRPLCGINIASANGTPTTMPFATGHARFAALRIRRAVNLDQGIIEHGTTYGKVANADLFDSGGVRRVGLRFGTSGQRIGDARNMTQLSVGGGTASVPTSITYTATAGTPATATISVAAFTMIAGTVSVSYAAKTVGVTGSNGTGILYYLYLDDPTFSGTGTLVATTTMSNAVADEGRLYIGKVNVGYPTSGSSGGSGGGPCVCIDMALFEDCIAAEARPGIIIDCLDLPTSDATFRRGIGAVRFTETECVRIITDGGAELDLSACTPFDLLVGGTAEAGDMLGHMVVTDRGIETVVSVKPLGVQPVARISVGGVSYAAGRDPSHRIYSHNVLKP
jgi:hypothetical protein